MGTIVGWLFLCLSIYVIGNKRKILYLIAINYILTMLMQWYGMDFGVRLVIFKVYPSDMINIVLLFLLFVSLVKKSNNKMSFLNKNIRRIFCLFALLTLVSTLVGFAKYGIIDDYIGDLRKFANLIIPILYFSKNPILINEKRNKKIINYTMNGLLAFCYVYWIVYIITGYDFGSIESSMRSFHSDAAIVIALYSIYLVYYDLICGIKRKISFKTSLYLLAIILLQHNSVYASLFAGITTLVIGYGKTVFKRRPKFFGQIAMTGLSIIVIISFFGGNEIVKTLSSTFGKFSQARLQNEGTIGTRYTIWQAIIATLQTPFQWLFGKPMGTGYHVEYLGNTWAASPHSGYIECLMRTGIIGMLLLFGTMILTFIQSINRKKYLLSAFIVAIMSYWYPYSFTMEVAVIIGNIMWYITDTNSFVRKG